MADGGCPAAVEFKSRSHFLLILILLLCKAPRRLRLRLRKRGSISYAALIQQQWDIRQCRGNFSALAVPWETCSLVGSDSAIFRHLLCHLRCLSRRSGRSQ